MKNSELVSEKRWILLLFHVWFDWLSTHLVWFVVMHFSWCSLLHVVTRILATLLLITSKSTLEPVAETLTSFRVIITYYVKLTSTCCCYLALFQAAKSFHVKSRYLF